MTNEEALEIELATPLTYIERNGVYYQLPIWAKKDLEDFKWLKSKLNLTFLDSLSSLEDKQRLLEIMGLKITY